VRIFTVGEELEFAGHTDVGNCERPPPAWRGEVELELRIGKIPVTFEDAPDGELPFGRNASARIPISAEA